MFTEHKKTYTDDEYIVRMWERECIQDQASRFMLCWSNGDRRRAIDELWVRKTHNKRTASFGTNIGYYVGMDEVVRHFIEEYEQECDTALARFQAAAPEAGYTQADRGLGMTAQHSCTTPLVYIADDAQTARYLAYDVGMSATGKPDGTADGYFEVSLIFIEFAREDDEWKIWHVVEEHDFSIRSGEDYDQMPRILAADDPSKRYYGTPTKPVDVYDPQFGWEYIYYDMPAPYRSYEEEESYGPEGRIGKKYYDRII